MYGLAGLFLPGVAPRQAPDLDAMLRVMVHRGPDGSHQIMR